MKDLSASQSPSAHSVKVWVTAGLLLMAATLSGALLDPYVSITSQAMIYVLAVVIAAYKLDWVPSAVSAVAAVTALNFFFVPPRWTFEVESREHFIALAVMLVVALVISHLAASLRRESRRAAASEQRARQLQALASSLADASTPADIVLQGQQALDAAFSGPNTVALAADIRQLPDIAADGMRCCMTEQAVLGSGTGRWPGLNAWYLPLGSKNHTTGAVCVQPALAADVDGREHAQALCGLLAQALQRVNMAVAVQAAEIEAQRQQLQSTFLAAVSHDLRTPLAAIVGAASALQTQSEKLSPTDQHRLQGSIVSEASYLSTLTENTLQLVRLTSPQQALQRDWESLEEIVGSVLGRVRQRDLTRRIKSRVPAGLPLIRVDPVMLAQLISNLLDNALQYSDGEIDLTVDLTSRRVADQSAQALVISVKDRGPGIPDEEQELIFEPYRRGDQSGPRESRGAGLGLALCRAIAAAHGGSLTVSRRTGGGSCFSAMLPLDEPQPQPELP